MPHQNKGGGAEEAGPKIQMNMSKHTALLTEADGRRWRGLVPPGWVPPIASQPLLTSWVAGLVVNGVSTQGSLPEEVTGKLIPKGHSSFTKPAGEKTGLEVGTARTKGLGHGRESKVSMAQPSEWRKTTDEEADQIGTGTVGRARTSPLEDDLDLTVYEIRLHRDQSAGPQGGGTQNFVGAEEK